MIVNGTDAADAALEIEQTNDRVQKSQSLSDDELLQRTADGDQSAYLTLYERYADRLFMYALRLMQDRDDAKDALQNALVKVYENAGKYNPGSNASAWIYRITRNVCIDMLRGSKEHVELDETVVPAQEPRTRDVALQEALTSEIESLPPIYREAVILRDVQGHSYKEIAMITDTSLSTIKFRIFKARDILRERLAAYLGRDEDE